MAGSLWRDIAMTDSQPVPAVLATRCPHCQTQFRVTPQLLALREGMVRCGACRDVFNGEAHLTNRDAPVAAETHAAAEEDASGRMTLIDFDALRSMPAPGESTMQLELDALSKAIAELQSKPWSQPTADTLPAADETDIEQGNAENTEPGFVKAARRRQRTGRLWTVLLVIGIPLLLIGLAAQLTYLLRNEIAAHSPEAARYLRAVCRRIDCTITLPAQIETLSIESRQLQALPDHANHFELVILLRNLSTTSQAWPALDLQLNDANGQAEIRKVFRPTEFLKASEIRAGIPAASEREIRLRFELNGDPAHGFALRIFYP